MPYLPGVTLTRTSADAFVPTVVGDYGNIWEIKVPTDAELIAADATTNVNPHIYITLPTGYQCYITETATGIAGVTTAGVEPCIIRASGSIVVPVANVGAGLQGPTPGGALCYVIIEPMVMAAPFTTETIAP